jgi:hypothetical protein
MTFGSSNANGRYDDAGKDDNTIGVRRIFAT